MMSHYEVRLFNDDASIVAIGEGLLAATLPRDAWTHEAHLAACCWLLRDRPDISGKPGLAASFLFKRAVIFGGSSANLRCP